MPRVIVKKAIIWRNKVVFLCGITIGRRHIEFNIDLDRGAAIDPHLVVEQIREFVQNYPNPQDFINAEPWEGYEFEL